MKKLLLFLLFIPTFCFADAGGGAGVSVRQESQHPLRHKANRIDITDTGSYFSGTTVEDALQALGAETETDPLSVHLASPPDNPNASGTTNTIAFDSNYIYVCTATNTWKRVGIDTWVSVNYFLLMETSDFFLMEDGVSKFILN